jgi:hypothetical protein
MMLTRSVKVTVVDRACRDPEFAKALLGEGAILFLNGEPDAARLIPSDLIDSLVGCDEA